MSKFDYIGVDPPENLGFDIEKATRGESENAVVPYEKDLYGCKDDILVKKRLGRNPFFTQSDYKWTNPEMKELIEFCGEEGEVFSGLLPWKD